MVNPLFSVYTEQKELTFMGYASREEYREGVSGCPSPQGVFVSDLEKAYTDRTVALNLSIDREHAARARVDKIVMDLAMCTDVDLLDTLNARLVAYQYEYQCRVVDVGSLRIAANAARAVWLRAKKQEVSVV